MSIKDDAADFVAEVDELRPNPYLDYKDTPAYRTANALLEAEKVVEFYADNRNFGSFPLEPDYPHTELTTVIEQDGGEKARTWLNKIRGE